MTFHHLICHADFIGMAQSRYEYALYLAYYPCLYKDEQISRIHGEVYHVDKPTLDVLDELEGHPHLYQREQIPVILDNGQETSAWVYFFPRPNGTLEPSGDYTKSVVVR